MRLLRLIILAVHDICAKSAVSDTKYQRGYHLLVANAAQVPDHQSPVCPAGS